MEAVINNLLENVKKKNGKKAIKILILIIVVILIAVTGIMWWIKMSTTVTTDNAKVSADLLGVSSDISGKLVGVFVQEGDMVQEGQIIAKVDDSQHNISVAQAQAALELAKINFTKLPYDIQAVQAAVTKAEDALVAANAQMASAMLSADDAKRVLDINTALYQQGAISKDAFDSYTTKYNMAAAAMEVARANVTSAEDAITGARASLNTLLQTGESTYTTQEKQAQAAYDNASLTLELTNIKAPISGTVVKVTDLKGEYVTTGQSLVTIVNPARLWVTANIDEDKVARIKKGQTVTIKADAYPKTTFPGQVTEVLNATQASFSLLPTENTSGNFTKVVQRVPVKISVDPLDQNLSPGMSVVVTIITK